MGARQVRVCACARVRKRACVRARAYAHVRAQGGGHPLIIDKDRTPPLAYMRVRRVAEALQSDEARAFGGGVPAWSQAAMAKVGGGPGGFSRWWPSDHQVVGGRQPEG